MEKMLKWYSVVPGYAVSGFEFDTFFATKTEREMCCISNFSLFDD